MEKNAPLKFFFALVEYEATFMFIAHAPSHANFQLAPPIIVHVLVSLDTRFLFTIMKTCVPYVLGIKLINVAIDTRLLPRLLQLLKRDVKTFCWISLGEFKLSQSRRFVITIYNLLNVLYTWH